MNKSVLSMLSLCQRAGRLVSGELSCEKSLQSNNSFLIIIAEDSSENTKNKFKNKAYYYNIPVVISGSIDELSHAIGKNNRVVLSVVDKNFADKIKSILQ